MSILTCCLFALGVGCRSPSGEQQSLLGEWEDTDLSKTEHVSQFAKEVLDFRKDGTVVSYMVDRKGNEIKERSNLITFMGTFFNLVKGAIAIGSSSKATLSY